jgi:alcohol dehydrogenase
MATQTTPKPGDALASVGLPAFDFQPQTRVVFGPGTLAQLGQLARELGGTRILLVTDPGLEAAGHPQRAVVYLKDAGLEVFVFDKVEENPTTRHVDACLRFAQQHAINLIVTIGGGSSMDCGKGVNFLLTNGGQMADYKGFGKATKPMLPSIGVPTTSGTGSEAQSYALIADERSHLKMACGDRKAAFRVAILDAELTITQPARVTAITGVDALAHALESYVSTRRSPLSQLYARAAWELLEANFDVVMQEPGNLPARAAMQLGANYAGTAIENSMLGACHACANPLTAHYGLTHGIAIGILMPHVLRFNAVAAGAQYRDLAVHAALLNGDPNAAAEVLAHRMIAFMKVAQLPTSLSEAGVSRTILPLLAEEATQQWTGKFNPRPASEADLVSIYEAAF